MIQELSNAEPPIGWIWWHYVINTRNRNWCTPMLYIRPSAVHYIYIYIYIYIYMNDIHKVSANPRFILYADEYTTITSPLCSFTHGCNDDISLVTALINLEFRKISDWLAVNKLSLNVQKPKFMIFYNYQKVISANEIPDLIICET